MLGLKPHWRQSFITRWACHQQHAYGVLAGRYEFTPGGLKLILMSYCTPISQGRSRIFYCLAGRKQDLPKKLQLIFGLVPSWLKFVNHFQRNDVLDGDSVFLHGQVRPPGRPPCLLMLPKPLL